MTDTEKLHRALAALQCLRQWNPLRGDMDAYFYAVAEWGLGGHENPPEPEQFGLDEDMAVKEKR